MNGRVIWRVLLALVVIGAVASVAAFAYNAGVARGVAERADLTLPEGVPGWGIGPGPYYGGPFFHPRPFGFGFGFLGCLFPLLFVFLVFGLMRGMFWRGPWGWKGHRHSGPWEKGVPPPFEEWHRRAHGETSSTPGEGPQDA